MADYFQGLIVVKNHDTSFHLIRTLTKARIIRIGTDSVALFLVLFNLSSLGAKMSSFPGTNKPQL